jgi:hypothetical protein
MAGKDDRRPARGVFPGHVGRAIREAEIAGYPLTGSSRTRTRTKLERRLLWLCRRHWLPEPEVNTRRGPLCTDPVAKRRSMFAGTKRPAAP